MKTSQILCAVMAGAPLTRLAAGQSTGGGDQPQISVYNDGTNKYRYYGCYNETTEVEGSDGSRALSGGTSLVKPGEMTVPICLTFCAGGDVKYRYAGVEWARECWCAQNIAGIAAKLDDKQCNYPCEGNKTMACGGALKLNVYRVSSAPPGVAIVSGAGLALTMASMAIAWFS